MERKQRIETAVRKPAVSAQRSDADLDMTGPARMAGTGLRDGASAAAASTDLMAAKRTSPFDDETLRLGTCWWPARETRVTEETTMAKAAHHEAAEHHEKAAETHKSAAKAHKTAAEHVEKPEHDEHAKKAHKASTDAHESSTAAHKRSTEAHGKSAKK
jgi:cell division septation protein DedD